MFTIGVLASWQIYEGTTIGRYFHALLRGIQAAAAERGCNLLLACGVGGLAAPQSYTPAWPVSAPDTDFVPVGPWNTDGLVVIAHRLSAERSRYLQELSAIDHPIVFVGPEVPGPAVVADNAGGMQQAFAHLLEHGHTHIAFIAGYELREHGIDRPNDSDFRLQGYLSALRAAGLAYDPRLVVYGAHNAEGGKCAMQRLLATGVHFTAVMASNDLSCLGAMQALSEAGLRIPQDVATIGFDDILDAKAHAPPLTTVRNSTFTLGYQSLQLMCDLLEGRHADQPVIRVPTQLVIRQSCGCRPGLNLGHIRRAEHGLALRTNHAMIARAMAEAALIEARYCTIENLDALCGDIVAAFLESLRRDDIAPFEAAIIALLGRVEALDEDAHAWHAAILVLREYLPELLRRIGRPADDAYGYQLIEQAHLEISERARRLSSRALLRQMDIADELGLMAAQLLGALDEAQIPTILAAHLPRLGVQHMLIALFERDDDDLAAQSSIWMSYGIDTPVAQRQFPSRQFPPAGIYPPNARFQLALLPLRVEEQLSGFVAFEASNLEPCAAIVRNLAAALRSSQFYRDALEGRKLAEDASQLKSRFLSVVSHELRTPLNLIMGLSELLLRDDQQPPMLSADLQQDLEHIATNAQHLGRLIGDVLDLTSSEAGQLRLAYEPLDLGEALRMVAVTGERMARDKGLAWHAVLPQPGPQVQADRTRMRQIVLNLVSNAIKFTSAGSVTLEVFGNGERAVIRVSDTGTGISPDEQQHIFDERWLSERTRMRTQGGIGLGLTICKQLVDLHSGTIAVHSAGLGTGATFVITLPALRQAHDQFDALARALPPHQPVLVFAEQAADADRLVAYLTQQGYPVELCDGNTDIAALDRFAIRPGALLVESRVASRRGWEIARALQGLRDSAPIPLLLFSLDPQDDAGALLELNYHIKPLNLAQFTQALQQHGLLDPSANGALKTILIVDDNDATRAMHARMVQDQLTYRILEASNGHAALAVMRETLPDLVLLDLMMPELDGFGVLEAMRADERLCRVPVVVLTAQSLAEDELARLNRGVSAVLVKGLFSVDETLQHITVALDRSRRIGSPTQQLVHKALAYLQEHYAAPLSRQQLADHIGVHENYLTDCFHREMGITPIAYLTRYRIRQARALLEAGQPSITEVAQAVGFADSAYFSRVFQREVGVSPSAYQRGRRNPL
ncbi:MAG: substrate-binding domain-containing protein [Roseiflexaceae bacterium]